MGEKIESETQSLKRLQYLDLAKAVGMLCVLIGHSFISEKINTVIYAFHMPLFFFIAGFLFWNSIDLDRTKLLHFKG